MPPLKRSPLKTLLFVCMLTVSGTFGILLAAELAIRVRWAIQHHDAWYLVMGFSSAESKAAPVAAAKAGGPIALPTISGTKQWNPCVEREIFYRVNSAGGRGPEWPVEKTPGTIRVVAIGESSTFGAANDEEQTWPVLLEAALRKRGLPVEVFNFGIPGQRIKGMIADIPKVLEKYRPDIVVHYGGFNETWDSPDVPQWFSWFNYRSALYTYIYEKMYFRAQVSPMALVPDATLYERKWSEFAGIVRQHGASLVAIAQAVEGGAGADMGRECAVLWRDASKLADCLNTVINRPNDRYARLPRSRMMKTVVLEQVLAEVAHSQGIPVIDPRAEIVETPQAHLFCDEIHLTDQGNERIVAGIVDRLAEVVSAKRQSGS